MNAAAQRWSGAVTEIRAQWRANPRLRIGVAAIIGTLWLWALLVCMDEAKLMRGQVASLQAEVDQLQPLVSQVQWRGRTQEARSLLDAARELQWVANSVGAGEAKLQDVLRDLCSKAGLSIVDLSIVQGGGSPAASGVAFESGVPLRARLATEFNRQALLALLSELQGMKPMVMVDVVKLRPNAVPSRAELEIRVQMRLQDASVEAKP